MPSSKFTSALPSGASSPVVKEDQIEYGFIGKLQGLKYAYRADIRDRAALERNFREKSEALSGNQFTALVWRTNLAQDGGAGQVIDPATEQVTEQVRRLLFALEPEAAGTKELVLTLQLKHRPSFLESYLNPALQQVLVEMTQPDSPRSPTQKYRLTAQGKALLQRSIPKAKDTPWS